MKVLYKQPRPELSVRRDIDGGGEGGGGDGDEEGGGGDGGGEGGGAVSCTENFQTRGVEAADVGGILYTHTRRRQAEYYA